MRINNSKTDQDFILKKIAISIAEEDSKLFDELENDNTIINPNQDELDKCILTMIDEHLGKKKYKKLNKFKNHLAKVAILILILSAGFIIPFATVDAFRIKVLNFFIENSITHSSFTPTEEKTIDQINIGYVPNGYRLTDKYKTSSSMLVSYSYNSNTIDITFYDHDTTISIDTEDCQKFDININNENGYIYKKVNYVVLLYKYHGDTITIECNDNLSKEELLRIANSIK